MTDEGSAFGFLNLYFELWRINHSVIYAEDGRSTNCAESFHGRVWRAQKGVYHRLAHGPQFDLYLSELAFRHSHHEINPEVVWKKLLGLVLQHPVSARFYGYWQGATAA